MSSLSRRVTELFESDSKRPIIEVNKLLREELPKIPLSKIVEVTSKINEIFTNRYTNIRSRVSIISRLRTLTANGNPERLAAAKKGFEVPKEIYSRVKSDAERTVSENNRHQMKFKLEDVYNIMNNLGLNLYDNIIYVQLATGRRFGETILSKFKYIDDSHVLISHLEKSKRGSKQLVAPILPGGNAEEVIERVGMIHKSFEDWKQNYKGEITQQVVVTHFSKQLQRRVKDLFDDKDISSHILRKIWVTEAYKKYGKDDESFAYFISRALGHSDLRTSLNYTNVSIT